MHELLIDTIVYETCVCVLYLTLTIDIIALKLIRGTKRVIGGDGDGLHLH